MNPALEQLSKEELLVLLGHQHELLQKKDATIAQKQEEVELLQWQVDQLKRMAFGQKRERFEANSQQLPLPFEVSAEQAQQQEEELVEKIEYVRKKQSSSAHKGRVALPDHLEVEEVEIYPEGDLAEMTCIGKEVTEELECVPAKLFIRRYIRYKYAPKNKGFYPEFNGSAYISQ